MDDVWAGEFVGLSSAPTSPLLKFEHILVSFTEDEKKTSLMVLKDNESTIDSKAKMVHKF